jgi:proline dehydrogenase
MVLSRFITKYTSSFKSLPSVISRIKADNQIPIIDYANENGKDYRKNVGIIKEIIKTYPNNTFALKFSSLGCNEYSLKLAETIIDVGVKNNSTIMIDAEQDSIQDFINTNTDILIRKYNRERPVIYKTYQMYRKDGLATLRYDLDKFKATHLGIKLVRGAYFNSDSKKGVLFSTKDATDASFNTGLKYFDSQNNKKHHMVVASHNKHSLELVKKYTHTNISVAHLLGFSDDVSKAFVEKNYRVYKYLPYGNYRDTFPYLIRRLYENYPILLHL